MAVEMLLPIVAGILVIVFANLLSRRIGVAGPLVLVAIGLVGSLIPAMSGLTVPPNLILIGVLPPLLYSAAVSAPAIEFRRDLRALCQPDCSWAGCAGWGGVSTGLQRGRQSSAWRAGGSTVSRT